MQGMFVPKVLLLYFFASRGNNAPPKGRL
jgi:hypothetical protein